MSFGWARMSLHGAGPTKTVFLAAQMVKHTLSIVQKKKKEKKEFVQLH